MFIEHCLFKISLERPEVNRNEAAFAEEPATISSVAGMH